LNTDPSAQILGGVSESGLNNQTVDMDQPKGSTYGDRITQSSSAFKIRYNFGSMKELRSAKE
jgi:hypothetical protein